MTSGFWCGPKSRGSFSRQLLRMTLCVDVLWLLHVEVRALLHETFLDKREVGDRFSTNNLAGLIEELVFPSSVSLLTAGLHSFNSSCLAVPMRH